MLYSNEPLAYNVKLLFTVAVYVCDSETKIVPASSAYQPSKTYLSSNTAVYIVSSPSITSVLLTFTDDMPVPGI